MKKKVAIIFPKDSESLFNGSRKTFGGATVQLYNYARELGRFHSVHAFLPLARDAKVKKTAGISVVPTFDPSESLGARIIRLHKRFMELRPHVVIQRGLAGLSPLMALYCFLFGMRFIFMYAHDRESRGRYQGSGKRNPLYFLLLLFASKLVVQSEYQRVRIPILFRHKTVRIASGYSMGDARPGNKKGVLWVGRIEPWKRPESFIELAGKMPRVPFTMVAPAFRGFEDYAARIYRMAEGMKNLTIIDFVPFDEIDGYFRRAKVFVNTSTEEGFPNTFVQACMNFTPIVSLNVDPDGFIERHGVGFFCHDDDEKLFDSLLGLMKDRALFRRCSESAHLYARENHSIESNARALAECF
jgi:glycosyltransferase involved in cell wall biosynthesis